MTAQILWKAYPLIMAALAILAVTKFRFLQHGQANTVLALIAFASSSTLLYNSLVEAAVISNLVLVGAMLYRSFRVIRDTHYAEIAK